MDDRFKKIVKDRHEYARAWKERTGGKVLGYYETYFPEELAYAAGMLPVRFLTEYEPDSVSAKWLYGACYTVKNMVCQFLNGRYGYLDAIVTVEGCNWMYNGFEVMMNNSELFNHYFFIPDYVNSPSARDVVVSELKVFRKKLEEWTGNIITDESIDNAIEVYNTNRKLLRRLYELRRDFKPLILGSEAMSAVLASQIMDKAEINVILEEFIREVENREPYEDSIRLMLIGSETFDTGLEEIVESVGGNIVIDELDNGSSYIWDEIIPKKDRLSAIAMRYLGMPHSALKDNNWRRRPQRIFELSEDYFVDGAIIAKQIYCHPHGTDNYIVWKLLRERMIPYHYFERDATLPFEETKIRLEAFLNMIRPGLSRVRGWNQPVGL